MKQKVLIVEDNELNMKLFNDLLEAHGIETIQTRDGRQAFGLAKAHRPDLIIMDIQLPEVSGLDITKMIKEDPDLKSIPVIAVTAFAMKGTSRKSARAAVRIISPSRFQSLASSKSSVVISKKPKQAVLQ